MFYYQQAEGINHLGDGEDELSPPRRQQQSINNNRHRNVHHHQQEHLAFNMSFTPTSPITQDDNEYHHHEGFGSDHSNNLSNSNNNRKKPLKSTRRENLKKFCFSFFPSNICLFISYAILIPFIFFLIVTPISFSSNSLPLDHNFEDLSKFSETRALNNWKEFINGKEESREFGSGKNVEFVQILIRKLLTMKKDIETNSKLKLKVIKSPFLEPVQKIDNLLVILCDEYTCDNLNTTSVLLSTHIDTVENSPGFSNNMIGTIISLELISNFKNIFSNTSNIRLTHQLAFLFTNGAELDSSGANDFITKYSKPNTLIAMILGRIKRFINLSSLGGSGKSTLVQSKTKSMKLFKEYSKVPYPYANVMVEELTWLLINSQKTNQETTFLTDFNVLSKEINNGMDLMFVYDSYVMGSQYDHSNYFFNSNINNSISLNGKNSGSIQHLGENLNSQLLYMITKLKHDDIQQDDLDVIYFDFIGKHFLYMEKDTCYGVLLFITILNLTSALIMPLIDHYMFTKSSLNRSQKFEKLTKSKLALRKVQEINFEQLKYYNSIIDKLSIYFRFKSTKTSFALFIRYLLIIIYFISHLISILAGIFTSLLLSTIMHHVKPKSWYTFPLKGFLIYSLFYLLGFLFIHYLNYLFIKLLFSKFGCFKNQLKQNEKSADTNFILNSTERDRLISINIIWSVLSICFVNMKSSYILLLWNLFTFSTTFIIFVIEKIICFIYLKKFTKFRIELEKYFSLNVNEDSAPYLEDDISSVEDLFNDFNSASSDIDGILNYDFNSTNKQSPSQFTSELSPLFLTLPSYNNGNNNSTNNINNSTTNLNTNRNNKLLNSNTRNNENISSSNNVLIRKTNYSTPTLYSYFRNLLVKIVKITFNVFIKYQVYWTFGLLISSFIPSIISIDILQRLLRILIPFSGYSFLGLPGDSEDVPFPDWLFSSSILTSDLLICLVVISFTCLILTNFINFFYKSLNFVKILIVVAILCFLILAISLTKHFTNQFNDKIITVYSKHKPQRIYLEQSSDYLFNYENELKDGIIIDQYTRYYPAIEMISSDKSSLLPPLEYLNQNLNNSLNSIRYFSGNSKVTFNVPIEFVEKSMFTNIEILNYTRSPYYNYSKHELTLKIKLEKSVHVQGLFVDLANGPYIEIFDLNSQDPNYQSNDFYQDYGWSNYSRIFKYDILSDYTILDITAYSSNYDSSNHVNNANNTNNNNNNIKNELLNDLNEHYTDHKFKRNINNSITKHNSNNNNFLKSSSASFIKSLTSKPLFTSSSIQQQEPLLNSISQQEHHATMRKSTTSATATATSAADANKDDNNLLVIYSRTYQCDWKSVPFGEYFFKLNEFTTPIGKAFCSFVQDTALIQFKLQ